jgi:hypothetical protein
MRHLSFVVVGFVLCGVVGVADIAVEQPVAPPTIRVTVQPDTGVLTIAGTGLGPKMFVSMDVQPVTVLPGASDTQVEVMAPATVVTTPGSYRLTVVDPVRRVEHVWSIEEIVALLG